MSTRIAAYSGEQRKDSSMAHTQTLVILLAAGSTAAGPRVQPELAPRGTMDSELVAHIYYNLATGEKVATLLGGVRPADNGVSPAVWIADNTTPCVDFGITGTTSGVMDDPDCTTCFDSTATGQIYLDWGDIPTDQVVDCVGITWASDVQDVDLDGPDGVPDGLGDGVEGFGATWAWFDAENGFDSSATRRGITGFTFFSLPGWTGSWEPYLLPVYTATIDLATTFSSSIVFEIGDTDSIDGSGTGLFNPGAGADMDSDGLADFGYAMQYIQPGTVDFDNADGDDDTTTGPDGDPALAGLTGWPLVTGNGDVSTDGTTYTPETDAPGAQGIEDAFDVFIDVDNDGVLEPIGTFWYGGFKCADPAPDPFDPFAQFYMQLYGPGVGHVCCCVDIFPPGGDGNLNFFDVALFIDWFVNEDPRADIFPVGGDGQLNFFDVNAYVVSFNAGCP